MFKNESNWKNTVTRFLLAQTVSLLGSSLVQYAIVWYITISTSSGVMLTVSTICGFAPQIIISLFAGVLLDRYDRKKVIMISDGIIAAATLALAVSFYMGNRHMWLLFLVLAVRSAGTGIQTPAVSSVLPQITPAPHLMKVNGLYSTITSITMFLSPALSGAILSVSSLEVTLMIDVVTAVIGISITSFLLIPPYSGEKKEGSPISDLKQGFQYLKANNFVRNILIFQIAVMFLISPSAFLTPLMVSRSFGEDIWRLTASEMTYSIGSILGGLLISWWGGFRNRMTTVVTASFLYGACMLGLGSAPVFWIYLIVNTLIGITSPCYSTPMNVTIQEKVEPKMHGRVFSFMQIASSCALPLGMALFGPLADTVRIQNILMINGILILVITMAVFFRRKSSN